MIDNKSKTNRLKQMLNNYELYLFIAPALIYFIIFHYAPMYGVQIAFRDYQALKGITGSTFVGLKHFIRFFNIPSFRQVIVNTLSLSLYSLLAGFPVPIILALVINELKYKKFRRVVQTVSYAPHFISIVVLVSMLNIFCHSDYGVINKILNLFGRESIAFITDRRWFRSLYVVSGIWQNAGWGSIVYLSALSGIDPQLHESAMIDGASRLKRIWHINLPGILPTISLLFILQVGGLMSVGFEKVFLMQNPLNLELSEVISTYVYKVGLLNFQFSFSSAVGLFNSMINCTLLVITNYVSKSLSGSGLF